MKRNYKWVVLIGTILLAGCKNDDKATFLDTPQSNSNMITSSSKTGKSPGQKEVIGKPTISFMKGVNEENETRGDKYNYYALEGQAKGFDKVTAIIEGTAVDFRNTDNLWQFDYPYPAPNVETEVTFTTDSKVKYGQTGIDLKDLLPQSYITITFIPNEEPTVEEPSVTVNEGETHTFRNEEQGIVEMITVTNIEVVDADPKLNPIGDKLLKVDLFYANEGTITTHMAPNYYSALDGQKHFLPLRYTHFWLKEVRPGESFTETIFYDLPTAGPYMIQFFDGAWLDATGANGNTL